MMPPRRRQARSLKATRRAMSKFCCSTDPVDCFWVRTALGFDGKPFKSITQGAADLDQIPLVETSPPARRRRCRDRHIDRPRQADARRSGEGCAQIGAPHDQRRLPRHRCRDTTARSNGSCPSRPRNRNRDGQCAHSRNQSGTFPHQGAGAGRQIQGREPRSFGRRASASRYGAGARRRAGVRSTDLCPPRRRDHGKAVLGTFRIVGAQKGK